MHPYRCFSTKKSVTQWTVTFHSGLLHAAFSSAVPDERPYLALIRSRIKGGSPSELLVRECKEDRDLSRIVAELAACLRKNTPYLSSHF